MKYLYTLLLSSLLISSVLAQDNLFWVGGSGSWNDPAHWSLQSGGTSAGITPTVMNNVMFDENSFTGISDTVTIDTEWGETGLCKNMLWTPDSNAQPVFNGNDNTTLKVAGSMFLSGDMDYEFAGIIEFVGTAMQTDTIETAGNTLLNDIIFDGYESSWILADNLTIANSILFVEGNLNTNGKQIECGSFLSDFQTPRVLTIENSTIKLLNEDQYVWFADGTNLDLLAVNSIIFLEGAHSYFKTQNGSLQVYGDIFLIGPADSLANNNNQVFYERVFLNSSHSLVEGIFSADSVFMNNTNTSLYGTSEINVLIINAQQTAISGDHHIGELLANGQTNLLGSNHFGFAKFNSDCSFYGDNTFDTLILLPGNGNTFYFEEGKTQIIMDSLYIKGHQCANITLKSTSSSELSYIKKDYGNFDVHCDFLNITHLAAESETLDFYAGENSTGFPEQPPGWIFEDSSAYMYGFKDTIEGCLGEPVLIDAASFNGDDSTLYFWNGSTIPGEITYTVTEPSQVTIKVLYAENCFMEDSVVVVFDTCENSIQENQLQSKVRIYPNPSDGIFTLEIKDNFHNIEFSLLSLNGIMLFNDQIKSTGNLTTRSFDFSYFTKGIYNARLILDGNIITKKVIIR